MKMLPLLHVIEVFILFGGEISNKYGINSLLNSNITVMTAHDYRWASSSGYICS